jgi:DNA-binding transcriptional LysR family regulator
MLEHLKSQVLTNIVAFTRVVETKSFTAAARQFGMSKATVSKQVSMLEARVGVRLLNRTTRTLSLTSAGSSFYTRCRHIIAELNAAEIAVKRLGSEPYGALRVTAWASIGRLHVAPVIGEFLNRYPNMEVDLTLSDGDIDLGQGGYDVAILTACHGPENLQCVTLAPCAQVICAAPSYLDCHGRPETPDDLPDHSCMTCADPSLYDAWALQGPDGLQYAKVTGRLRTDSWDALRMAALSGHGLALIPLFLVNDDLAAGRLCRVLPEYLDLSHSVYAVCPGQQPVSPSVEAFLEYLKLCFGASQDRAHGWDGTHQPVVIEFVWQTAFSGV